jgi:Ala-tRNA(Pro) deacylase|tara:strand:- start:461 stop:958 length:498 start_codon:yes stop_codon:yes gene_type:complete
MTQKSADDLFQRLETLGIETTTIEHPPVFTVDEAKEHRGELEGVHIKNLFLRNKKKKMWLVVAMEDTPVDLKALGQTLDAGRLSFGSADRLEQYLGVIPGAVTPFAAINDVAGEVKVVLDRRIFEADPIHCHPLVNTMTTAIRGDDLKRFLSDTGHEPSIVDLPS